MNRIRFKDARVRLKDAAVMLATTQEPWASFVRCSIFDFLIEDHHPPYLVVAVMRPIPWSLLYERETDSPSMESHVHKVVIWPTSSCPEGEVRI